VIMARPQNQLPSLHSLIVSPGTALCHENNLLQTQTCKHVWPDCAGMNQFLEFFLIAAVFVHEKPRSRSI